MRKIRFNTISKRDFLFCSFCHKPLYKNTIVFYLKDKFNIIQEVRHQMCLKENLILL